MFRIALSTLILGAVLVLAQVAGGQSIEDKTTESERKLNRPQGEFQFVRLAYSSNMNSRRGWGGRPMWKTDWPDAEHHFLNGVDRLTRIATAETGRILTPLDDDIFDYPWIYAVEVGYWSLSNREAAHLRDYLLRGGFLMVDDFHGTLEWASFVASMEKIFPDRPIVDIPEDDEAFHVIYDLDHRIQIPSRMIVAWGVTYERDGYTPRWRGIYDDDGRLLVAINFNMDIGDAWEHADWPSYPENMTALAYRFGIIYVVYEMTH
jgi:hypothetical protein